MPYQLDYEENNISIKWLQIYADKIILENILKCFKYSEAKWCFSYICYFSSKVSRGQLTQLFVSGYNSGKHIFYD